MISAMPIVDDYAAIAAELRRIWRLRQRDRSPITKGMVIARVARGTVEPVEIGVGKNTKPERLRSGGILRIDIVQQAVDGAELRCGSRSGQANEGGDN